MHVDTKENQSKKYLCLVFIVSNTMLNNILIQIIIINYYRVALIIGMILFGFIAFSRDSNSDSYHNEGLSMIPYFIAFLLTVGGIITLMCWGARVRHRMEEDVENVCDEISTFHSGIYMHIMKERYAAGQLGGNFRSDSSIYIEGVCECH